MMLTMRPNRDQAARDLLDDHTIVVDDVVMVRGDDRRASVGLDHGHARPAIKGRFDLDTEFAKSAYRNTKGRRVSGLSIGYAIRNSTKTAAGNELTDLRHDSPQLCAFTPSPSIPCR